MKNSYYFPHDYHARHDPKIQRLVHSLGYEGLGIYWCLIEIMYEEGGYLSIMDIPLYAKVLQVEEDLLQELVNSTNLFIKNDHSFHSPSLISRLNHINTKRRKAKTSANKRWDANAMRTQCERNAIKESKVKESKEDIYSAFPFLKDDDFKKAYTAFLEMRKNIKKPVTKHAEELLLKDLHKDDVGIATKRLEQSIINSWRGIFPLKKQAGQWKKP